jgi:hypothetical protein
MNRKEICEICVKNLIEYEPDDDPLEIEVVADWQLAFQEDDGKVCYVKQVRGFLGATQLYAESDMQVKVFPDAWEPDLTFVLTAIFTPFIARLGSYLIKERGMEQDQEESNKISAMTN